MDSVLVDEVTSTRFVDKIKRIEIISVERITALHLSE